MNHWANENLLKIENWELKIMRKIVLNIPVDDLSETEVLKKIREFVRARKPKHIATVNPEFLVAARKDPEFRIILQKTDLNIPDGFGLRLVGIEHTVTGTDLVETLAKQGYRMYLLGATPGVAKRAGNHLQLLGATIAGAQSGPQENEPTLTGEQIIKIRKSKADILIVAFGQIKQEKFIAQYLKKLEIPVAIGVGGAFDYFSGAIPRAPKILRELGLEWLFRLIVQPSRLKRIFTAVVVFPLLYTFSKKKTPMNRG